MDNDVDMVDAIKLKRKRPTEFLEDTVNDVEIADFSPFRNLKSHNDPTILKPFRQFFTQLPGVIRKKGDRNFDKQEIMNVMQLNRISQIRANDMHLKIECNRDFHPRMFTDGY